MFFRNHDLRLLIIGSVISSVGDWLNTLALMSLMVKLTDSGLDLSILMILRAAPNIILGPVFAGFIDRFDKKKLLVSTCFIDCALVVVIPLFNDLPAIYTVSFLLSAVGIFTYPTVKSLVPMLVKKQEIIEANAVFGGISSVIDILSPLLSGIILSIFALNVCFYIDSLSFVLFAILVMFIKYRNAPSASSKKEKILLKSRSSIAYIYKDKILLRVVQGSFLGNLSLGIIYVTEILFFKRILNIPPARYGFFVAIVGVGLLLGAVLLHNVKRNYYNIFSSGVILLGTGIILFSFTRNIYVASILLIVEGVGESLFTITTTGLIQLESQKDNCAGLFTINESLSKAAYIISISFSGILIDMAGVQYTMLIAGVISASYIIIYMLNLVRVHVSES